MSKNTNVTPDGTRDLLFEECEARLSVEQTLKRVFKGRGFTEVITPSIEFMDIFSQNGNQLPIKQMYKFSDSKGRMVVMRPDSTVPIARLTATRLKSHVLPIRLYYNQAVYCQNRLLSGRSDEIVQAGIEIIGSESKKADLEVISTAVEALHTLKTEDFRLEIGHIGIFNTLMRVLDINDELSEQIRRLIELKNYPALNDLLDNLDDDKSSILKQLPRLFGGEEVFEKANMLFKNEEIKNILDYLKDIYTSLSALGLNGKITLDLGMVQRAEYYTGVVFRGYIEGFGEEVLSGGRYDRLLSGFGRQLAATGFGINVDAIANALLKAKEDAFKINPPAVLIHALDGYEMKAFIYSREFGKNGTVCENSLFETKEQAAEYAKLKGIKQLHVISETTEIIDIL